MHMLAAQGYCVICIDSRGSRHRGIKFESHIRCRMGQVELNDQVDALRILADQLGYIDMNRVGIHGWSYGKKFIKYEPTFVFKKNYFRRLFKSHGPSALSQHI